MKDRIRKVIDYKSITAGELALRLGVQRSNISHVLNGRNKPGASFIESFLNEFPDINARWLLTGHGEMLLSKKQRVGELIGSNTDLDRVTPGEIEKENLVKSEAKPEYKNKKEVEPKTYDIRERKIDRIVVFYNDKTFVDYKPE